MRLIFGYRVVQHWCWAVSITLSVLSAVNVSHTRNTFWVSGKPNSFWLWLCMGLSRYKTISLSFITAAFFVIAQRKPLGKFNTWKWPACLPCVDELKRQYMSHECFWLSTYNSMSVNAPFHGYVLWTLFWVFTWDLDRDEFKPAWTWKLHNVRVDNVSWPPYRDSFKTVTKYWALSDLLRSLIVLRVPRQMLSIAEPFTLCKTL